MNVAMRAELCMGILSEPRFVKMNNESGALLMLIFFIRAEHCDCKFYDLSFANMNFLRTEHCECIFYELSVSFAHVNFMGADLCECDFYES